MALDFRVWKGCENLTTVVELLFLRTSAAWSVLESTFDHCDRTWGRVSQHHDWHDDREVKRLPHRHATLVAAEANVAMFLLQ
jgi:hypothetical protein